MAAYNELLYFVVSCRHVRNNHGLHTASWASHNVDGGLGEGWARAGLGFDWGNSSDDLLVDAAADFDAKSRNKE